MSAGENANRANSTGLDGDAGQHTLRKRSQTMPSTTGVSPHPEKSQGQRGKRKSRPLYMQSFLDLTHGQAKRRKWLYAGYTYLAIVILVLGPIRYTISKLALDDFEPFGWAIGYLFGDLPQLRTWVVRWDLQSWIALPPAQPALDEATHQHPLPFAERLRTTVFGPANTRLLIAGYMVSIIGAGMMTVLRLRSVVEVDTRRKVFHGMMVAMMLPTIPLDPLFVSLALALVLAVFLLLDLIRASQLPPLSAPLAAFLAPYVDGRDLRGPVVVSHIFLLVGCAIPLWLSLAATPTPNLAGSPPWRAWDLRPRDASLLAGVVCVGLGDAAASLVGRRFGRRKWPWAGAKSLEGSAAFAVAVTGGLLAAKAWLAVGGWEDGSGATAASGDGGPAAVAAAFGVAAGKAAAAACGASLMEAVLTGGNDNVIVPVVLWLLVRGLRL